MHGAVGSIVSVTELSLFKVLCSYESQSSILSESSSVWAAASNLTSSI